jgi:FAD/FMN-containing dehydrogenase
MKVRLRKTWKNTIRHEKAQPVQFITAENLTELSAIIINARQNGFTVKTVGSGHSFNDIACSNGYMVNISQMNKVLELPSFIRPAGKKLVQVEAGISIRQLNSELDKRNLSVVNLGGIDHQTLAGAIATATHGSGIDLPAIHGMVRSIVLVAGDGKTYRIEPVNGISDPAIYNEPDTALIQSDEDFNAVLVSLGCMGIIYSYILEVLDMYWLEESKQMDKWSVIRQKLLDKSLLKEARHVMVLVNPYETDDDHTCLITRINITKEKPQTWWNRVRSFVARILSEMRITYWIALFMFRFFPKRIPKSIDRSIKALRDDSYINKSYAVLYQGSEFIKERAFDSEFAFDISTDYISVVEKIFETTRHFAAQGKIYMTSPIGMRFVKASGAYLAPDYDRDVCYIDTPFLQGTVGADELLEACQDIMFKGGGFPHWGKKNSRLSAHMDTVAKTFPKLAAWKNIQKKFDPDGLFANNYTSRFLLT